MWDQRLLYTLGEAYWRTGFALFGPEWTGYESLFAPQSGIAELRREYRQAINALERAKNQIKDLQRTSFLDETEEDWQLRRQQVQEAPDATLRLSQERDQLATLLRGPEEDQEAFDRRRIIECRLIEAFRQNDLTLIYAHSLIVEWDHWAQSGIFKVNFPDSLIYAPHRITRRRRATGYLKKSEFDTWLEQQPDILIPPDLATDEDRAGFWLKQRARKDAAKPKKAAIYAELEEKFPSLTGRALDRVWASNAPPEWKKPGAGKKNSQR